MRRNRKRKFVGALHKVRRPASWGRGDKSRGGSHISVMRVSLTLLHVVVPLPKSHCLGNQDELGEFDEPKEVV